MKHSKNFLDIRCDDSSFPTESDERQTSIQSPNVEPAVSRDALEEERTAEMSKQIRKVTRRAANSERERRCSNAPLSR